MDTESFLLTDKLKLLETLFLKDGWVTIYESHHNDINDQTLIYCCLVDSKRIKSYQQDSDWIIEPGSEGKPTIWGNGKYETLGHKGIEPFLFSKHFNFDGGQESYIDISEEFILYFKLYEKGPSKQSRKFYFIDDAGDLDEVIVVEQKKIKIKLKYLKEYLSIRKIYFSICFDFMRIDSKSLSYFNVEPQDKDFHGDNTHYNHFIRSIDGESQSWIRGKTLIRFDKNKKSYHLDNDLHEYAKFIIEYDNNGNEILQDCKKEDGKDFTLTYFKKEVLDKYYNDPRKYKVDGWHVSSAFFSLKIDNNVAEYVPVFLTELGMMPYKEQLHWKQYNIPPQKGISQTFYQTMVKGDWAKYPEAPDLYFKQKYELFSHSWEKKFGWKFYKALAKEDIHIFTSLHIPTKNNVKTFCEQILSLTKITIDRLNEKEFTKSMPAQKNDRSITKLDIFLKSNGVDLPEMITFLRMLWDLRSGLLSHSFSNANKACKEAIMYFDLRDDNYVDVATNIFVKSIYTLNTLETKFLN
jgi:hypothetical protein